MTHAEEGYGSCLESLVVSGDETIVATVQVAAPSGEQARLARLIGQL